MAARLEINEEELAARVAALTGFDAVRDAARRARADAYLVGGAVRDALLGREVGNLDVVVAGDPGPLIEALGGEARLHDRFGTATVELGGRPVDVARARTETYTHPGALPEVRPAALEPDLARRDFTVNAIAVPLGDPGRMIDPHRGVDDLRAGLLRVLHDRSFVDDPTRALRAARYAARLGLEPEPRTREALPGTDLSTVSADRVDAELRRLAAEPSPRRGFELLDAWGLVPLPDGAGELIEAVAGLAGSAPWAPELDRGEAVLAAARGPSDAARALAAADPGFPSEAVEAARGHPLVELALARALGAAWLDDYVGRWRHVRTEISGEDLLAAGVRQGPAVGRGLAAALRARLDGEARGREDELRIALRAAGGR